MNGTRIARSDACHGDFLFPEDLLRLLVILCRWMGRKWFVLRDAIRIVT